ncbi:unnamed protein product [Arctia plantaginis]|uniref:BED-type domain-containing protein n=1 Tax=Arctia plantaginis TaxID=874455 RepID=A0A8S0ZUB5_ARCPL|nr:unnamed protein product [Arctia plantaginis]
MAVIVNSCRHDLTEIPRKNGKLVRRRCVICYAKRKAEGSPLKAKQVNTECLECGKGKLVQMSTGATLMAYDGFTFWKECRKHLNDGGLINWYCSSKRQCNCKVFYCTIYSGDDFVQCVPTKKGHQILFKGYTYVFKNEQLPEWTSIYFLKVSNDEIKCNLCDINLKVDEKSLELLEHLKTMHKDVYDLHKDNPEATVGFRIEFLHLNMLKDDVDPKTQPVILGEVCEATTEPIIDDETAIQLSSEKADEIIQKDVDTSMHYVLIDNSKKKTRESTGPRKRSWVWKYFDKLSNIIYRCRLCNVVLSIKGCNSNNMNRHVRTRHPLVFKSEVTKRERVDSVHVITSEMDTPYAIKTEEIYASDKDYEEISESPSQKLRRSWIWSYFDRVSSTQAQCKLCKRHICHGGNATGNMNRHLKMIHKKTACSYDQSLTTWVWKVFEDSDDDFYTCKICQFKCLKHTDIEKSMEAILNHLKVEHGVVSGDQIITEKFSRINSSERKRRGAGWSQEDLVKALHDIGSGQISQNAAAKKYNIPRRTLRNHLKTGSTEKIIGRKAIFTEKQEREFAESIKKNTSKGTPLTPKMIRQQAFLYCKRHNIKNNFNNKTSMAGRAWLERFLERNINIPAVVKH